MSDFGVDVNVVCVWQRDWQHGYDWPRRRCVRILFSIISHRRRPRRVKTVSHAKRRWCWSAHPREIGRETVWMVARHEKRNFLNGEREMDEQTGTFSVFFRLIFLFFLALFVLRREHENYRTVKTEKCAENHRLGCSALTWCRHSCPACNKRRARKSVAVWWRKCSVENTCMQSQYCTLDIRDLIQSQ